MKKSLLVVALGMCLFQSVWADGFEEDGVSDVAAYEGQATSSQDATIEIGVVSAVFTPGIDEEGFPMGVSDRFFSSVKMVYFDTELDGMVGEEVTHRWFYKEHLVSEKAFVIDKAQFSATSKKSIKADQLGEWRVEIRQKETLLEEKSFHYLAGI